MTEGIELVPVLTLHRQIEALAHLGLDVAAVRAHVGELPSAPDALVPVQAYNAMWSAAESLYALPGLPSALAMVIPFGAFGALDYVAGSAETVGGLCESVLLHLSIVAVDVRLVHVQMDDGHHVIEVRGRDSTPIKALEFTLASIFGRLRYVTQNSFRAVAVGLPVERPADDPVRRRLWGAPIAYSQPCAGCTIDADTWAMRIHTADPYLHATLKQVAAQLHLAPSPVNELEQALRVRLRDALSQGRADAERLAGLLGVSERTLQRRLQDLGLSFTAVVEQFRHEEAMRLLQDKRMHLVQIAARLGYTEQTSFTRAFRRWTGETPGAWRAARSA
ncbi:MAG: helix-turn-helix domain-containing protein [Rhizobiales bacterium]|nr:helix-turn-helix domain-containing protein [Rhizobacter sp.]